MVAAFIVTDDAHLADKLAALGDIFRRDFIFREDGRKRAFRDACAAVDAGIGVDVKPRPLFLRLAGENALHRAYIHATAVTQTQACNNVSHKEPPGFERQSTAQAVEITSLLYPAFNKVTVTLL
jgi:hypothetical protein